MTIADAPAAPWLAPFAAHLAALAPLDPPARLLRLDAWAREAGLATESGRALRFVPADPAGSHGGAAPVPYELRIFEAGEVATRTAGAGARHDLYNALAWLAYPRAKARLNALHARAIACACVTPRSTSSAPAASARGPLRDAATLFDENGALWIGLDADLEDALRAFDWQRLFVAGRERLARAVRVAVFGHALLEKLDAPYKAVTAHAWPLRLPPGAACSEIDAALAHALEPGRLSSRALCPLPVMGLPGWCEANRDPAFYNDAAVFRTGRRQAPGVPPPTDAAFPGASLPARPVGPRPPRD
jgi:hypothetical protein